MQDTEPTSTVNFQKRLRYLLKSPRYRLVRMVIYLVGGLAGVLSLAYFVNSGSRLEESENPEHVANSSIDSFERVFAEGNSDEIMGFMKLIVVSNSEAFPVQLEKLNDKIKLGTRLLEIATDDDEITFGHTEMLYAKLGLLSLYQRNDLETDRERQSLESLASSLVDHESPKVQRNALVTLFITELEEYRQSATNAEVVKEKFNQAAQLNLNDSVMANQLIGSLNAFSELSIDTSEFFQHFRSVYSKSSEPAIQKMLSDVESAFFRRDYRIPPLSESEAKYVRESLNERMKIVNGTIAQMKSNELLKEQDLNLLAQSLAYVFQSADHNVIRATFETTRPLLQAQRFKGKSWEYFKSLDETVKRLGKELPLNSLVNLTGQEIPITSDQSATLVVFVKEGSLDSSIKTLKGMNNGFKRLIEDSYLALVFVYIVDRGDNANEQQKLGSLESEFNLARWIKIKNTDNESWFEQLPMPWSPSWLLIDRNQRLCESNPLPPVLRSRIYQYVK